VAPALPVLPPVTPVPPEPPAPPPAPPPEPALPVGPEGRGLHAANRVSGNPTSASHVSLFTINTACRYAEKMRSH